MSIRVGVDTGGTFTDLVALDEQTGGFTVVKCPSTPGDPGQAVFEALLRSAVDPRAMSLVVLGTTIGTNALLQRQGARVIYLTTQGFEDIPWIQRIDKKDAYDLQWQKPEPFVRRGDSLGVNERIGSDGSIVTALSSEELERLRALVEARIAGKPSDTAVAINLLFSFANSQHEELLKRFLTQSFPHLPVSVSTEISPIWREYERGSTTIIDAYLKPLMQEFIGDLEVGLRDRGFCQVFAVMKSNGAQMLSSAAKGQPVHTMLSGLSGGVIAGQYFGKKAGRDNVITFDMGGTSTDVAAVVEGELGYTTEYEVEFGIPVSAPFVDLNTIGAGGGSIAWIDKAGLLRVGPRSAGAVPGPVCYDAGGEEVTVTDANLVLGRLNPDYFLGGQLKLNVEKARDKMAELARALSLSLEGTAQAVIEVANENMANAIRVLTVDRGLDPREFSLVAFGGAGPLHGCEVAAALNMEEIIIPPHPGLTSAFGTLVADLRVDKRWTRYYRSDGVDLPLINDQLDSLVRQALRELRDEGFLGSPVVHRSISMRYAGQNYERPITVPPGKITLESFESLLDRFHEEHRLVYGYSFADETIELIHFNAAAIGDVPKPRLAELAEGAVPNQSASRRVYFKEEGYLDCRIYLRDDLPAGCVLHGPAVIEELDSTTLLHPGQSLSVTSEGVLRITWKSEASQEARQAAGSAAEIDSVTWAVTNNRLVNIAREMGSAMMHTAYSPIFSESRDFSCAIFDRNGEMIAQGEFLPGHMGTIPITVRWCIAELGLDTFAPGDVVLHNDPYRGNCHMPEHMMLKPVFYEGELVGFVAVIGHVAEIGSMAVGSFASNATEVFQEGLRLPPVKIMSRGQYARDLWRIILANHRTPRTTWGDFHAMMASLNVGEHRLIELMDRYGSEFTLRVAKELINYSERLMRRQIEAIPAGEYYVEDAMEDDGITDKPYTIRATVVVEDGGVLVDFTGSDPQAKGPINATYVVTASACANGVLQIVGADIPRNSGCYRPIKIIAPPGSIVNVQYPGPSVGGNTETHPRIVGMVLSAVGQVLPQKVMAAEGATSCNFLFGGVHPTTGKFYTHYHFEASGWGGRYETDGNSAQNHIHGNCRNTPVEVFETLYPFRVESYRLNKDSGGPGKRRGGLSIRRVLKVLAPEITVSAMMDHVKQGAKGAFGGLTGGLAGIWVSRAGDGSLRSFVEAFGTVSPSKFANVVVTKGDEIVIDSAGGGGYGNPAEREVRLVLKDVEAGFVSPEAAEEYYRVKITQEKGDKHAVDESATAELRHGATERLT